MTKLELDTLVNELAAQVADDVWDDSRLEAGRITRKGVIDSAYKALRALSERLLPQGPRGLRIGDTVLCLRSAPTGYNRDDTNPPVSGYTYTIAFVDDGQGEDWPAGAQLVDVGTGYTYPAEWFRPVALTTCAFCEATSADPCADGWQPSYWDDSLPAGADEVPTPVCPDCVRTKLRQDADGVLYLPAPIR